MKKFLILLALPGGFLLVLFCLFGTEFGRKWVLTRRIFWKNRKVWDTPEKRVQARLELEGLTLKQLREVFVYGEVQTPNP